jgi:chorismate mutase
VEPTSRIFITRPIILANKRQQLRLLDRQIAELVHKRLTIAEEIGEWKKEYDLPIRDFAEETAAKEAMRRSAKELGLELKTFDDLITTLIALSVRHQESKR